MAGIKSIGVSAIGASKPRKLRTLLTPTGLGSLKTRKMARGFALPSFKTPKIAKVKIKTPQFKLKGIVPLNSLLK